MGISRSENMRRIRARDTKPELAVRKLLREIGFPGYRLHRTELPGKPDIVFLGRRKAILIHGCFWHAHTCKVGMRKPLTNQHYWVPKIERNRSRDEKNLQELELSGWDVLTVWECELKDLDALEDRLSNFLGARDA
ncbi:MAG: very short patch repair endonuclease [Pseudomonadota bacterium]